MVVRFLALALILGPAATAAAGEARQFFVPKGSVRQEETPPEFKKDPTRQDLQALVRHFESCISNPPTPVEGMASIDQFLEMLERNLRMGNDIPRDRILRNADQAREGFRRAFNDLAEATSPGLMQETRDALLEVAEELKPLDEKNAESVLRLGQVADSARGTVSMMVLQPPESPGRPVPVENLSFVVTLRPEILPLREKLKKVYPKLKRAKALIERAKQRSVTLAKFAEKAGKLDEDALGHLSERRTRGRKANYETRMLSREIILNANKWLLKTIEKSDQVIKLMEEQMDPKKEGVHKAVNELLIADRVTMDSKELITRSGNRINFNHKKRLNGVIRHGWETASENRRPWWVGRSQMARNEGVVDSGKMDEAKGQAEESGRTADGTIQETMASIKRLDEALGRSEERPPEIARRVLDVPAPSDPEGAPIAADERVKSKPIKIPHTLDVSDAEIISSYDNR
ncbi:MAG: hypothetical protein HY928_06045 [Elusimicrobia bacterium]|nr:hypothetical protein [Elusimicrobiota bacterium]